MAFVPKTFNYGAYLTALQLANIQNNFAEVGLGTAYAPLKMVSMSNSITLVNSFRHIANNSGTWVPESGLYLFGVNSGSYHSANFQVYVESAWSNWAGGQVGDFGGTDTFIGGLGLCFCDSANVRFVNPSLTTTVTMYYLKVS